MDRREIFKEFEEQYVKPRLKESLQRMEEVFQKQKEGFKVCFLKDFRESCDYYNKTNPQEPLAYMTLELLRTNLVRKNYKYRIMAYKKDWYLAEGEKAGEVDMELILSLYHQLEEQLKEDAKRYVDKIQPIEVETHVAKMSYLFQEYIKELIRYAIADATDMEEFLEIKKETEFQIRVGECLEPGYLVYMEQRDKDRDVILAWLKQNKRQEYCYQDFKGLNFAGEEFTVHDFRYADFRDGKLEGSNLGLSLMTGVIFRRCCMKGAKLTGGLLHGSDFTHADLREAQMDYTLMYDGQEAVGGNRVVGYPEGKFTGADLREANFRNCVYCSVDFRGADLRGADFYEACLYRCRFTKEQMTQTKLSEEQKKQILLSR